MALNKGKKMKKFMGNSVVSSAFLYTLLAYLQPI